MRIRVTGLLLAVTVMCLTPMVATAHPGFGKSLKERYSFRSASCTACHLHKDDTGDLTAEELAEYEEEPKAFYNPFGKLLLPPLSDKKVGERVQEVKDTKRAAREAATEAEEEKLKAKAEALEAALTDDFLKALAIAEAMKDERSGKTYAELLKAGEIDGVRLPE